MDWNKWAEDMFDSCSKAIKEINPSDKPLEWKFYWDMLQNYKTYREAKDRSECEEKDK